MKKLLKSNESILTFLIPIISAIVSFFIYGIDFTQWKNYGTDFQRVFLSKDVNFKNDYVVQQMQQNIPIITKWFHHISVPIYDVPVLFILFSFIFKVLTILLLAQLFRAFDLNKKYAVISSSIIILFTSSFYGNNVMFFNGAPIYLKTQLCGFLILLSLVLFIKNKTKFAYILFGLSVHLHLFNSITAFIFIIPAIIFFDIKSSKAKTKDHLYGLVIFGLFLIPYLFQMLKNSNLGQPMNLNEWYLILNKSNDSSTFQMMEGAWGSWFLLFCYYFFMRSKIEDKERTRIDVAVIWNIIMLLIFLFIELLIQNNIFLGKISELYLTIQPRRGMWVISYLLLVPLVKHLLVYKENLMIQIVSIVVCALLLKWNFYLLVPCYLLFFQINKKSQNAIIGICITILFIAISLDQERHLHFASLAEKKNMAIFILVSFSMYLFIKKIIKYDSAILCSMLGSLLILTLSRSGLLYNDLSMINQYGWFEKVNEEFLISMRYTKEKKDTPNIQNPLLSDGYLISKWLQINNVNYNTVFAPPLLIDQAISQSPQLLSDIGETILTNYSPVHAENYKNKIEKIYKVSFKEIFRANDFDMSSSSKIMNNLFSQISEEHMQKLSSEFGFKIVITKTEYLNFKKINKINDYFIYLL